MTPSQDHRRGCATAAVARLADRGVEHSRSVSPVWCERIVASVQLFAARARRACWYGRKVDWHDWRRKPRQNAIAKAHAQMSAPAMPTRSRFAA